MGRSEDLQALATRLVGLAEPLLRDSFFFPIEKALLSRDGGVCADDGARLLFDPLSPHIHCCPNCGKAHEGDRHHRAWVWHYHLWLSERAIHLALLGSLRGDEALLQRSGDILDRYASEYRNFPNSDNVLGPTRLFFSTYLESTWLVQIVMAASILDANESQTKKAGRWSKLSEVIEESSSLIASFNEGWSNRQVWNNTALVSAGIWLNDDDLLESGLDGRFGLLPQLVTAVSDEGLWFEGENYHFFALRGFLLAAELLRGIGVDLYGQDGPEGRLRDMFTAPLLTLLPDLTIPARGDAPFGVSIVQPRFAELWEIGWSRTSDERLQSVLTQLYSVGAPDGEDPGLVEIAEQEQNRAPQRLSRRLLGWKALLWSKPEHPRAPETVWQSDQVLLGAAGLAVLRSKPERYLSMECGGRPGGHGHPDLLHVTIFWDDPLFMDFGTASYVSPSLHWYRSTLAHNSPGVSGIGQLRRDGSCSAFDSDGEWSWCRCVAEDVFGKGTRAVRILVAGPSCIIDVLEIVADDDMTVDLPIHPLGATGGLRQESGAIEKSITWKAGGFEIHLLPRVGEELIVSHELGPPDNQFADGSPLSFVVRRAKGSGTWTQCYARGQDCVEELREAAGEMLIAYADGSKDRLDIGRRSCRIVDRQGRVHKLAGTRKPAGRSSASPPARERTIPCQLLEATPSVADWEDALHPSSIIPLGQEHYRRSEKVFGEAGQFEARCAVFAVGSSIGFAVTVAKGELLFRCAEDRDPALDNETPDINSDGIQCYVERDCWSGYLIVPELRSNSTRIRSVAGSDISTAAVTCSWCRTSDGYRIVAFVDIGRELQRGHRVPVNLVVNEMWSGRARRSGQLVLSGGGGWVYLRGDREARSSAAIAEVF